MILIYTDIDHLLLLQVKTNITVKAGYFFLDHLQSQLYFKTIYLYIFTFFTLYHYYISNHYSKYHFKLYYMNILYIPTYIKTPYLETCVKSSCMCFIITSFLLCSFKFEAKQLITSYMKIELVTVTFYEF